MAGINPEISSQLKSFVVGAERGEAIRVQKHLKHFEGLWSERDEDVEVFPFPVDAKETLKRFAMAEPELKSFLEGSHSSSKRKPMPHQLQAIESWKKQGKKGRTAARYRQRKDIHSNYSSEGTCSAR